MNVEKEGEWMRNDESFPRTWVYIERERPKRRYAAFSFLDRDLIIVSSVE